MNKIFRGTIYKTVTAGATGTTDVIDLGCCANTQKYSLQITATGTGTATVSMLCSNDHVNYSKPEEGGDIIIGFTNGSGPGSDGISRVMEFEVPLCKYIKFQITETGGSNTIIVQGEFCVQ